MATIRIPDGNTRDIIIEGGSEDTYVIGDNNCGRIIVRGSFEGSIRVGSGNKGEVTVEDDNEGSISIGDDNSGDIRIGDVNQGDIKIGSDNKGDVEIDDDNEGDINIGDDNEGKVDIGDGNDDDGSVKVGDDNKGRVRVRGDNEGGISVGDDNEGDIDVGDVNQGDISVGDDNEGDIDINDDNEGSIDVGDDNKGDINVGDKNQGKVEVGKGNKGRVSTDDDNDDSISVGGDNQGDICVGGDNDKEIQVGMGNCGNIVVEGDNEGSIVVGGDNSGTIDPRGDIQGVIEDPAKDKCREFFAEYDRRFLPGSPFNTLVREESLVLPLLFLRFEEREQAAVEGREPDFTRLDAIKTALADEIKALSDAQLALYRECFEVGGNLDQDAIQECFAAFANGELIDPDRPPEFGGARPGEPDGSFFFLFAEFALLAIDCGFDAPVWQGIALSLIKTQEIFIQVYEPVDNATGVARGRNRTGVRVSKERKERLHMEYGGKTLEQLIDCLADNLRRGRAQLPVRTSFLGSLLAQAPLETPIELVDGPDLMPIQVLAALTPDARREQLLRPLMIEVAQRNAAS